MVRAGEWITRASRGRNGERHEGVRRDAHAAARERNVSGTRHHPLAQRTGRAAESAQGRNTDAAHRAEGTGQTSNMSETQ